MKQCYRYQFKKYTREKSWLIFTCSTKIKYSPCVSFFKPSKPVSLRSILENKFGNQTEIDKLFVFRDAIDCGYNYAFCFSNLLSTFWLFTNQFSVILPFHPKNNLVSLSCDNQMLAIYVSNYDATSTCQPTSKTKQDYQNSISKSA